jgi:hypothetical protein
MLLSIATLGGSDAMEERLNANIHASDTYAFYSYCVRKLQALA